MTTKTTRITRPLRNAVAALCKVEPIISTIGSVTGYRATHFYAGQTEGFVATFTGAGSLDSKRAKAEAWTRGEIVIVDGRIVAVAS